MFVVTGHSAEKTTTKNSPKASLSFYNFSLLFLCVSFVCTIGLCFEPRSLTLEQCCRQALGWYDLCWHYFMILCTCTCLVVFTFMFSLYRDVVHITADSRHDMYSVNTSNFTLCSILLSGHLPVCLSACLPVCLSVCLSLFLSLSL